LNIFAPKTILQSNHISRVNTPVLIGARDAYVCVNAETFKDGKPQKWIPQMEGQDFGNGG
jgi:hypothetical protein